nr:MAG TPA: hypothetical protein [Caudoviricetes sp.]
MLAVWSTLVGCTALVYHYFKDRHATGLLPSPCALSWVSSLSTLQRYDNFRPKANILTHITLL